MSTLVEDTTVTKNALVKSAEQLWSKLEIPAVGKAQKLLDTAVFPTTKRENWKYTRVAKLLKQEYNSKPESTLQSLDGLSIPEIDGSILVFENGLFRADLSSIQAEEGITISTLSEASESHGAMVQMNFMAFAKKTSFITLNAAYPTAGAFIHAAAKATASKPIHLVHVTTAENMLSQPHHLIVAERSSKLDVVMSSVNTGGSGFVNAVTEVVVNENADVSMNKLQNEGAGMSQIATEEVLQKSDSRFAINTITLSGDLVRNNLNILVDGTNCETHLNGLYLPTGKEHVDNHSVVDHRLPHCESHELYKGILDGKSTGVFNGKVFVRQDAQKTNAFQSNANILMSDDATINSKPELEIYADDVKCSHGSTTGQFDEEALFYLRSRGISKANAQKLMMLAFAGDVVEKINLEPFREKVEALLSERFEQAL